MSADESIRAYMGHPQKYRLGTLISEPNHTLIITNSFAPSAHFGGPIGFNHR